MLLMVYVYVVTGLIAAGTVGAIISVLQAYRARNKDPIIRLILSMDKEAQDILCRLQVACGVATKAEVIKKALGLLMWALAKHNEGYDIGAFKDAGPAIKLAFPDPITK